MSESFSSSPKSPGDDKPRPLVSSGVQAMLAALGMLALSHQSADAVPLGAGSQAGHPEAVSPPLNQPELPQIKRILLEELNRMRDHYHDPKRCISPADLEKIDGELSKAEAEVNQAFDPYNGTADEQNRVANIVKFWLPKELDKIKPSACDSKDLVS